MRTALALVLLGTVLASAGRAPGSALADLKTRAERTAYTETSRYDDVMSFLRAVERATPRVHLTTFGYSFEGRSLPLAVVGRVADARPETVLASNKPHVTYEPPPHPSTAPAIRRSVPQSPHPVILLRCTIGPQAKR